MRKGNETNKKLSAIVSTMGFLLLVILIAGCAKTSTSTPPTAVSPTPSESSASTEMEETMPTESVTEVQTEEAADANCIACHVDKDQLISTADPVEEMESESSGEG
jgi:hypothetical protein